MNAGFPVLYWRSAGGVGGDVLYPRRGLANSPKVRRPDAWAFQESRTENGGTVSSDVQTSLVLSSVNALSIAIFNKMHH